jgi:lipid-binding SYLF domain-containing protein
MLRHTFIMFALSCTALFAVANPPSAETTVTHATEVLAELEKIPASSIPTAILKDAQAVVVVPRVIKAGFIIGGRGGHGLAVIRNEKGDWSDPVFLSLGGASVGLQIGVQATDLVMVFRKKESLDRILDGKGKLTLGGDIAVAAGPVGRTAAAATDGKLQAEIYSYSRSRGLFAGVALDGAVLMADTPQTKAFEADTSAAKATKLVEFKKALHNLAAETALPPATVKP